MSDRTENLTDADLDAMALECYRALQDARIDLARRIREGEPVRIYSEQTIQRLFVAITEADARGEHVSDELWSSIVSEDAQLLASPEYAQILEKIDQQKAHR